MEVELGVVAKMAWLKIPLWQLVFVSAFCSSSHWVNIVQPCGKYLHNNHKSYHCNADAFCLLSRLRELPRKLSVLLTSKKFHQNDMFKNFLRNFTNVLKNQAMPSSNLAAFREDLHKAKHGKYSKAHLGWVNFN